MFLRSPAISGAGDGSFRRSPLVEFGVGARSFAMRPCAAVCGRGAVALPLAVAWHSGEPFQNGAF